MRTQTDILNNALYLGALEQVKPIAGAVVDSLNASGAYIVGIEELAAATCFHARADATACVACHNQARALLEKIRIAGRY